MTQVAPWASVELHAIGTFVHVLLTEPSGRQEALQLVEHELAQLDLACSRFRDDSEIGGLGTRSPVSPLLEQALAAALRVADQTNGLVDPTLGAQLRAAGYDRTFSDVPADGPAATCLPARTATWADVVLADGHVTLPPGVQLDLGATAKAWAADRIAALLADLGTGALVNLGGDIAVAGPVPVGGWPVAVTDRPGGELLQTISIESGGLATSSTTARAWRRGGEPMHHILDPATGRPAPAVWAAVSVCATTCLDANGASTAAVVLGPLAPDWLRSTGLPSCLLGLDGAVLRLNGWPEA